MHRTDRPADPPHDRLRLTADEHAVLASLERSLGDDDAGVGRRTRVRARLAGADRVLGRLASRFVRLSPWLTLLGILAFPVAIAVSDVAGLACALVLTVALTTWLTSPGGRWSRWLAKQITRARRDESDRPKGHPDG